ncbi:MAG: hypothetical protein ACRED5_13745 [Propylenella sp.]
MASIEFGKLLGDMTNAAQGAAKGQWSKIKDSVKPQFEELARIAVEIEQKKIMGKLKETETRTLVEMQKNALIAVTAGMKGQLKLLAEAAVNAALSVLTTAVNKAVGFGLL